MAEDKQDTPTEAAAPVQAGKKFDFNTMVYNLWHGNYPLFQVFWLYYFAVVIALQALGTIVGIFSTIFVLFKLVWAGFMVKPIFVAADKYTGPEHWALLAKIAAVFIGIGVVADLLF